MADPRTFVLIGNFQDNITPALEKINNSINGFKRNMTSMATKKGGGYGDVTQSVGKLVSAQKHLKEAIEGVGAAAKSATQDLKDYKSMMGKVASAHYHIQKSGTAAGRAQGKFWDGAEKDLDSYKRKLEALQRQTRINPYRSMPDPGGRRVSRRNVSTPSLGEVSNKPLRGGRKGGGGGGQDYGFQGHMAEFGLAYTLGNAISQPIQNAVVAGFQIGVGMMTKPFEYFAGAIEERKRDEMSDLKTASGFFQINKDAKKKFLKTGSFQEAIDFAQSSNLMMDKLAASLPGTTQDYIEVQKRISDSLAAVVANDPVGAMKLAEKYRQEAVQAGTPGLKDFTQPLTGEATTTKLGNALQLMTGKLTTQTVLAGMGTGSGAQGAMGAYGLPQLTERMLSQDVSMSQLQRYAAIFRDPMIMRNLEKELPKISQNALNTAARTEAVAKFFEKVLPPELIERYRRTLAGVQETFNTAIFSPESGIFGIGRKLKEVTGKFDEFGRMLGKQGQIVTDINQQARIDMGLYDLFRDVLANLGRILAPIAENLSSFWDPLRKIGDLLNKARMATMELLRSFEIYLKSYGNFAKTLKGENLTAFSKSGGKELRASLATIANLFRQFGAISGGDFESIMDQLTDVNMDGGQVFKNLLDKFFKSDVAKQIGDFIGTLIGTVLSEVSQVTGFISGRIEGGGKLVEGLKKGFERAGGAEAFGNIFKDVFASMFKVLGYIFDIIPWQGKILAVLAILVPPFIQGGAMLLAESFGKLMIRMFKQGASLVSSAKIPKVAAKEIENVAKVVPELPGESARKVKDAAKEARVSFGKGKAAEGVKNAAQVVPKLPKQSASEILRETRALNLGFQSRSSGGKVKSLGNYTAKGTGITESLGTSKAGLVPGPGAKVTQSRNAIQPPSRFTKFAQGAIGGSRSTLGRRFGSIPRAAASMKSLKGAFAGGAKALPVNIIKVAKNAASGAKNIIPKGMGMLGKGGGALAAGFGIFEALTSLLSGDSLGTALGKGAGPILGTIIGTALLGPLGGIIGGMVGSMEGITKPLGKAFDSIINSFEPLASVFESLLGIIGDAARTIAGLFGADTDEGFNGLAAVLEPVVKLFQLLEVGIRGLAVALKYVRMIITEWRGTEEEKIKARREYYDEDKKLKARQGQMFAEENRSVKDLESERVRIWKEYNEKATRKMTEADSEYYKVFMTRSKSLLEEKYKAQIAEKAADAKLKGLSAERKKVIEDEIKTIQTKLADLNGQRPPTVTPAQPSTKPTTPAKKSDRSNAQVNEALKILGDDPSKPLNLPTITGAGGTPSVPTDIQKTAQATSQQNKKATTQIKETIAVKTGTDRTTTAVKELTAKITSQTTLQTSVAAIYNLLASGTLRVQTNIKVPGPNNTQPNKPGVVTKLPLPKPAPLPPLGNTNTQQENKNQQVSTPGVTGVWKGSLGDAVASEMKHKPAGSSLVVANSSETVIPAAGGLGMKAFMDTLAKGFSIVNQQYMTIANGLNANRADMEKGFQQSETKNDDRYNTTTEKINQFQEKTSKHLTGIDQNIASLTQKVATMSSMGGMFGGMGGGMDLGGGYGGAGVAIAGQLGNYIKGTGGAPGSIWEHPWHGGVKGKHADGSFHYSGRAIDIGANANEQAGVIARIKAFNAKMGVKPVEFFHAGNDPNHQDHVHVAYALGPNDGRMFSKLKGPHGAQAWEKSMVPGSVKVASITGNSKEGFGETNITNNMTITQQPGEDGEALANRVATLFFDAAMKARSSSIFT